MRYYKFVPIRFEENSHIIYAKDFESAIKIMEKLTKLSREKVLTYYYSFDYDIVESFRR